jgi:hypothetical protein
MTVAAEQGITLTAEGLNKIGVDLMHADLAARINLMTNNDPYDALYLPVMAIHDTHQDVRPQGRSPILFRPLTVQTFVHTITT